MSKEDKNYIYVCVRKRERTIQKAHRSTIGSNHHLRDSEAEIISCVLYTEFMAKRLTKN